MRRLSVGYQLPVVLGSSRVCYARSLFPLFLPFVGADTGLTSKRVRRRLLQLPCGHAERRCQNTQGTSSVKSPPRFEPGCPLTRLLPCPPLHAVYAETKYNLWRSLHQYGCLFCYISTTLKNADIFSSTMLFGTATINFLVAYLSQFLLLFSD